MIKKISSFDYDKSSSEGNKLENLEPILQEKLLETDIGDQVDIVELENTSGSKVFLSVKKNDEIEKINYHIYCSDINSEIFLKFDLELNFEDIIELYKQLLFPQEASFYIKTKFFKYTIPKDQIINELEPFLPIELNWIKSSYHLESFDNLLISEELWSFFLVDNEVITSANQINVIKSDVTRRSVKFILEKITAIFSLDIQQQINLGNILNSPYVGVAQIQDSDITPDNLNQFRINLLVKIMEASEKKSSLDPLALTELAKDFFFTDLSPYLEKQEIDLILNNVIKFHDFSVLNIHNLVSYSRQITVLMPALLQATNGHTDNLEKLTLMMGSDLTFNYIYQTLIENTNFIKLFPKTIDVLNKINFAITSPISKLLLLNSFYEIALTLTKNHPLTPEYQLAKNLLVDNSVIFGTILVEFLGLDLGFAGLIIDLGITIHQLTTFIYYFREKEHLDISFWEGIKFELGFSNNITYLFEEREILHRYTLFVNSLYEKIALDYQFLLLKIPNYEETKSIFIAKSEFPSTLQDQINKGKLNFISTFGYRYSLKIPKSFYRIPSLYLFNYEKKQYKVTRLNKFLTVNFTHAFEQIEENNIFVHKEKTCFDHYLENCLYSLRPISNCFIRKRCREKYYLIDKWKVVSSTKKNKMILGFIYKKKPI